MRPGQDCGRSRPKTWVLIRRRPLGFVTLGIAGHLAVGPADLGKVVSVDVSDWIHTNGLTVSTTQPNFHMTAAHGLQGDRRHPALCVMPSGLAIPKPAATLHIQGCLAARCPLYAVRGRDQRG